MSDLNLYVGQHYQGFKGRHRKLPCGELTKIPLMHIIASLYLSTKKSMKVSILRISEIQFWDIQGSSALCTLVSDAGIVSFHCRNALSTDAPELEHRAAWLKDALRQQRRMPEFRNCHDAIDICPKALNSIGVTKL